MVKIKMEDLPIKELQHLFHTLLDTVNCPICFNFLQPPVNQCENGHIICKDCQTKVNQCPMCNKQFVHSSSKTKLIDDILEVLPHECKHLGCKVLVKCNDDHERWCGFQSTECKNCTWKGLGKDIANHVVSSHKDHVMMKEESYRYMADYTAYAAVPIYMFGQTFWMERKKYDENNWKTTFILVPNGEFSGTIEVQFIMKNIKRKFAISIWLTKDTVLSSQSAGNSFILHSSMFEDLKDEEKKLYYTLRVSKNK